MLQFIPVFDDNTIAVRASGRLSHEDYQNFLPKLEAQINEFEKVSILFEFENFRGWDLAAAKDDYKFGMEHSTSFERIALVGDKSWEHWMAWFAKPFIAPGEVRYFNRENLQDSWDWLRKKDHLELAVDKLLPYKNIVVAVDFSKYSKHACKRAIEMAGNYGATLTLLNVVQEDSALALYGDAIGSSLIGEDIVEKQSQHHIDAAEAQMKLFVSELETDFALKTKVISGNTDSGIVSFLEAHRSDLVIMWAKKKKGLNKLMGSTTHYVQNHSRCDVLIVPVNSASFMTDK